MSCVRKTVYGAKSTETPPEHACLLWVKTKDGLKDVFCFKIITCTFIRLSRRYKMYLLTRLALVKVKHSWGATITRISRMRFGARRERWGESFQTVFYLECFLCVFKHCFSKSHTLRKWLRFFSRTDFIRRRTLIFWVRFLERNLDLNTSKNAIWIMQYAICNAICNAIWINVLNTNTFNVKEYASRE